MDQPEHGLTEEVLKGTDVLLWWAHMGYDNVSDEIVNRVHERVLKGMGLIVLYFGHFSEIFKKLMGTSCELRWREFGEVFCSGCICHRGQGKVFYFRPGHEAYPRINDENVLRVLSNTIRWYQGTALNEHAVQKLSF